MALYEQLVEFDLVPRIMDMGLRLEWDGTVKVESPYPDLRSSWIEAKVCEDRLCGLWLHIFFSYFQLIHTSCMSCWKIFYQPQTVEELFRIHKLQTEKDFDLPSKCGLELRSITGGIGGYRAFWYNPLGCSLDEARANCKQVEKLIGKPVQLKRGCTEMEVHTKRRFGIGSDDWDKLKIPQSLAFQEQLEAVFVPCYEHHLTPVLMWKHIMRKWIEFAMQHARTTGDVTYKKFIEPTSDLVQVVTYKGSIHRSGDHGPYNSGQSDAKNGSTCRSEADEVCKLEAIE